MNKIIKVVTWLLFAVSLISLLASSVVIGLRGPEAPYIIAVTIIDFILLLFGVRTNKKYWIAISLLLFAVILAIINPVYIGT